MYAMLDVMTKSSFPAQEHLLPSQINDVHGLALT